MKKNDGWFNALFSLVFIAVPAIVLFFFYLPSWSNEEPIAYGYICMIVIIYWLYVGVLSFILIKFEFLSIESLNFNVPISIALMSILLSHPLPLWATAIFVIISILIAFPVNMYTTNYRENRSQQAKNKFKNK